MIKKLIKLIKNGYKENPSRYTDADPIGTIIVSSDAEKSYISRFIYDKNYRASDVNSKKYILRVMIKEIIIQYQDIMKNIGAESFSNSTDLILEVEDYIIRKSINQ